MTLTILSMGLVLGVIFTSRQRLFYNYDKQPQKVVIRGSHFLGTRVNYKIILVSNCYSKSMR